MPDEDTSDSTFEVVAKNADPTLNGKGEQIHGDDDESSDALSCEMTKNQRHGVRNPSKIARTYQMKAKPKAKKSANQWSPRQKAPSLLDSPENSKEREPIEPFSPNYSSRLQNLRADLDNDGTPRTLDEYMSKCFSLKGILRISLFLVVFGVVYKLLGSTIPTKREFKIFKRRHYEESKESVPSLKSWPLHIDSLYYKPNIERIKYKDYGVLALARTVQKPGHYFVGILGNWFPMPYLAPRSGDFKTESTKKSKKQHAWGVCMAGRCVCLPQVTPSLDLSKCETAVWKKTWTKTVVYGGFVSGIGLYTTGQWEQFGVTSTSFVNPLYWFTFFTSPFLLKSYVDMVSTIIFTLAVVGAVQNQVKSNFRLWAIFFAGSYAYAFGSFLLQWILNDWKAMRRYSVTGVFGGLAAWLGFLSLVSEKPLFTWQFAALLYRPLSIKSTDLFVVISILDVFDSGSVARFGGLGMAFFVGAALQTFFLQPFL